MSVHLDAMCPSCSSMALKLSAGSAAHDVSLIELVAMCEDCGVLLDAFVSVEEMTVVRKGKE